ncbi:hypothetical protein HY605_01200 [Candidatus Peregrinibacteria bacterium]|nr:hypothetical protein [Candidatus Peregrinibacteria bacterium]
MPIKTYTVHLVTGKHNILTIGKFNVTISGIDEQPIKAISIVDENSILTHFTPLSEKQCKDHEQQQQIKELRKKLLDALSILEQMDIEG